MSVTLAIILLFLSLVYYYFKSAYFTLRGPIPGIPPHFAYLSRAAGSMLGLMLQMKERFGDVYQMWLGPMRLIMINCLKDAQHIFSHRHIYDQGDIFTENFRIINPNGIICLKGKLTFTAPLFRRATIIVHLNTITDCTDKLLDRWRNSYSWRCSISSLSITTCIYWMTTRRRIRLSSLEHSTPCWIPCKSFFDCRCLQLDYFGF